MMTPTSHRAARNVLGWVLLGLLVGLVGMHHVVTDPSAHEPAVIAHAGMSGEPAPAPSEHNDLLHLCLAIMTAAVVVTAALLARRTAGEIRTPPSSVRPNPRSAGRAPPPPVPRRLALLCVLRT